MSSISIEAREVEPLGIGSGLGHLYLVYKDNFGNEFVISGFPSFSLPPFGSIRIEAGLPIDQATDERVDSDGNAVSPADRGSRVLNLNGRDADDVWAIMLQQAQNIADESIVYGLFSQNSNSTIASVLNVVGIDISSIALPVVTGIDS